MRNADSRMYLRLMMMKKMDWREEFTQKLQDRRKNEAEEQKKRDLESSYFFATAASENSTVEEVSVAADAASGGINADVVTSPAPTEGDGGVAAEGRDEDALMEEETVSPIPRSRKDFSIDDRSLISPPPARPSNGRRERTLHDVVKLGKLSGVQVFVANQVDINEFDRRGVTPIFYAVAKGHLEVARYLANNGAGG